MLVSILRYELAAGVKLFSSASYSIEYPRALSWELPVLVCEACRVLAYLSLSSENVHEAVAAGGIELLVDVLVQFEGGAKCLDAAPLAYLSSMCAAPGQIEIPARHADYRNIDLSSRLSDRPLLAKSSHPALALQVVQTLYNILALEPAGRTVFGHLRGCELVCFLLVKYKNDDRKLTMQILRLMQIATSDHAASQISAGTVSCKPQSALALASGLTQEEADEVEERGPVEVSSNGDLLAQAGAAGHLVLAERFFGALADFSACAFECLSSCCSDSGRFRLSFAEAGGCELLANVLKKHSRCCKVVVACCSAIGALCLPDPIWPLSQESSSVQDQAVRERLGSAGVLAVLVKLVARHCKLAQPTRGISSVPEDESETASEASTSSVPGAVHEQQLLDACCAALSCSLGEDGTNLQRLVDLGFAKLALKMLGTCLLLQQVLWSRAASLCLRVLVQMARAGPRQITLLLRDLRGCLLLVKVLRLLQAFTAEPPLFLQLVLCDICELLRFLSSLPALRFVISSNGGCSGLVLCLRRAADMRGLLFSEEAAPSAVSRDTVKHALRVLANLCHHSAAG